MAPSFTESIAGRQLTPKALAVGKGGSVKQNERAIEKFQNPSLQVTADHKIKMVNAPIRRPKAGEVLLHIKATGICG